MSAIRPALRAILPLAVFTSTLGATTVHAEVRSVLEQRAAVAASSLVKPFADRAKPLTVGLKAFTYDETEATSPFLRECRRALSEALVASGKCKVLERETARLNELLQEDRLRESGMTATQSASLLGNLLEAEAMLFGKATDTEHRFRIELELLSTTDANKLSFAEMEFIKDELPPTGVRPVVHAQIAEATAIVAQRPQATPGEPASSLEIGILPTRAHNPVYAEGEQIEFRVWASRNCYLRLVCIDATGDKYQIFPNQYQSDYRLSAWQEQVIPSPEHPFRYTIVPPFGTEMILAFAATQPFALPGFGAKSVGPITQLDTGAKGLIEGIRERGIGVYAAGGAYAEARCVINAIQKPDGGNTRGPYIPVR